MPPSFFPLRTFPHPHSPKPTHSFFSLSLENKQEKKNQTIVKQKKKGKNVKGLKNTQRNHNILTKDCKVMKNAQTN